VNRLLYREPRIGIARHAATWVISCERRYLRHTLPVAGDEVTRGFDMSLGAAGRLIVGSEVDSAQ
jgi:hypothetical protein